MSRLDQHVAAVQNKLALDRFFDGLAKSLAVLGVLIWLAVLIDRIFWLRLPRWDMWLYGGLGATALAAIIYAIVRRPDAFYAAVRIDEVLNTKDKFATALHVRNLSDPFAHAALLDAERTANDVSLHKRFPLSFPRATYATVIIALIVLLTAWLLQPVDLFGRKEKARRAAEQAVKVEGAKKNLNDALTAVSSVPKALAHNEAVKLAKDAILQQLNQPISDPSKANRTAAKALQDVNEAIKNEIKRNQNFAEAENEAKMLRQLQQMPIDETGPMAQVQKAMVKGNFTEAIDELTKAVDNFDKMKDEDKEKAAEQMKQLANQLQQMAQNPQQQQQMQQQLQQMGLNQQQAQQAVQAMQQAAQGDKKAQDQLKQMAQQAAKQMNNGQGPNQQQQQQIQQMMKQMQAQANTQQQAQQMAQAAQQMAQAMQQGDDGQGDGPGNRVGRQQSGANGTDPLGRPLHGHEYSDDYSVKIPGEIDVQRVRRILEELRRRLSDPQRPQIELDYIERLLKDY
jgi:chemotaxis protein histidine kinase CheA